MKLKHDVVSLEEKVGHLILEIEKIKSFKDTVSEVITDDNINEDIVPVFLLSNLEGYLLPRMKIWLNKYVSAICNKGSKWIQV